MEYGKQVTIEVNEFFADLKQKGSNGSRYTEREKEIIIYAYENNYVKEDVARKLHTSAKNMRYWYEQEYLPTKEVKG